VIKVDRLGESHTFKDLEELETFLRLQNPFLIGQIEPQLQKQGIKWNMDYGRALKIKMAEICRI
jgi:hypothetical protein